jgi:hypothetical protein
MSEENLPVSYKEAMAAAAKKVTAEEATGGLFISTKGGVMSINEEPIQGNQLECVVVAYSTDRVWFDRQYNAEDTAPPECFAQSLENHDLIAHTNVPNPVHANCNDCPNAVFGSARQGAGPACKTYRKLAVMPSSALSSPEDVANAEIAILRVPPTSVKNFSKYANKMVAATGLPPWGMVTMVSVKPNAKTMFEVTFDQVRPVASDELLAAIHGRIADMEKALLTPYTYDEQDDAPKTKAKSKKF